MTWEEWVNSDYSGGEFIIDGKHIRAKNYISHIVSVIPSDVIISNYAYIIEYAGDSDSGGS